MASPLGLDWEDAVLDALDGLEPDVKCWREDVMQANPPIDAVIVLFDAAIKLARVGGCLAAAARLDEGSDAARVLALACAPTDQMDPAQLLTDLRALGLPEAARAEVAVRPEQARDWTSRTVSVIARIRASNGRIDVQHDAARPESLEGFGGWSLSELIL